MTALTVYGARCFGHVRSIEIPSVHSHECRSQRTTLYAIFLFNSDRNSAKIFGSSCSKKWDKLCSKIKLLAFLYDDNRLQRQKILERPRRIKDASYKQVYAAMKGCWHENREQRISFELIIYHLLTLLRKMNREEFDRILVIMEKSYEDFNQVPLVSKKTKGSRIHSNSV